MIPARPPGRELDLAVTVTQDMLRALDLQCAIGATPAFPPARLRWHLWTVRLDCA